jgi:hypothetical protein
MLEYNDLGIDIVVKLREKLNTKAMFIEEVYGLVIEKITGCEQG